MQKMNSAPPQLLGRKKTPSQGFFKRAHGPSGSVPEHFLLQLAALLRFQRQSGRRAGQQTAHANGLTGFIAVAVLTRVDQPNRLLNFLEQFALTVARAQLQRCLLYTSDAADE